MCPTGSWNHASLRLAREATHALNVALSVRSASSARRSEAGTSDRGDGNVVGGLLVEAHRALPARHHRQELDPPHDAPDERDVAVEVPRRLADDGVELGAVARIRRVVASHAHGAIAVHEPDLAATGVARGREPARESDLGRVGVRVAQLREDHVRVDPPEELGLHLHLRHRLRALVGLRPRPLHHVVVLHADHEARVEVLFAHEPADLGDVGGRERGRQLDHDAALRELDVQRVLRVERAPVGRGRILEQALRVRGGGEQRARECEPVEPQGHSLHPFSRGK